MKGRGGARRGEGQQSGQEKRGVGGGHGKSKEGEGRGLAGNFVSQGKNALRSKLGRRKEREIE